MKCLVTGATGHIGSFLVRRLLESGDQVAALIRPEADLWRLQGVADKIQIIPGEFEQIASSAAAIREFAPETVFHLGWYGVARHAEEDADQILVNTLGTLELFKIVRETECCCWVGLGSQAEYGPNSSPLTESTPTQPQSVYGVTKLAVGNLLQRLCEIAQIRFVWLRLLSTYGPMDEKKHLIPQVISQLLAGKKPALTSGIQEWDYLYVEDAARALEACAKNAEVSGIFNLGSGKSQPIRSVVEKIRDQIDPSLKLGFGEVPHSEKTLPCLKTEIKKISEATQWRPQVELDEGLRRTIESFRKGVNSHDPL